MSASPASPDGAVNAGHWRNGNGLMSAENRVTVQTDAGEITISWDDVGRFSVTPHWFGDIELNTEGLRQLRLAIDSALEATNGASARRERRASG